MKTNAILMIMVLLLFPLLAGFTSQAGGNGLWERMCEACHDGRTVLNGKVVIDKGQIKAKYGNVDELVDAVVCKAPPCMNILKHDEKLVRRVAKEIGMKEAPKRD